MGRFVTSGFAGPRILPRLTDLPGSGLTLASPIRRKAGASRAASWPRSSSIRRALPARPLHHHQPGSASRVRRRLYNQLGTAEQWIKEGENAIKWTRLSWRTFAANAVRLQPHALQRHASVRAKERDLALRFREPLALTAFACGEAICRWPSRSKARSGLEIVGLWRMPDERQSCDRSGG